MFIKICGITNVADARMVADAGANAIGLNFYADSPRAVSSDTARDIVAHLPPFVEPVGLFVNASIAEIRHTAQSVGLRTVQLHGNVQPALLTDLRDFSVVVAFQIRDESCVAAVLDFVNECERRGRLPSAVLIDAYSPEQFGGTGEVAPWSVARQVVERCRVPVTLAGGLTAKNVASAVQAVRPWGVDVASRVEVAPGRKEPYKVRAFIAAVRKAAEELRRRP